jgi:PAS domain S-box-containing protein
MQDLDGLSYARSSPDAHLVGTALIDRHEWFQITLSCIGDGVIASDPLGRLNYLNPAAQKLTGWTLAEAAGLEIEEVFRIVHEKTGKPFEQPVRRVIERGAHSRARRACSPDRKRRQPATRRRLCGAYQR